MNTAQAHSIHKRLYQVPATGSAQGMKGTKAILAQLQQAHVNRKGVSYVTL